MASRPVARLVVEVTGCIEWCSMQVFVHAQGPREDQCQHCEGLRVNSNSSKLGARSKTQVSTALASIARVGSRRTARSVDRCVPIAKLLRLSFVLTVFSRQSAAGVWHHHQLLAFKCMLIAIAQIFELHAE
jgi:hypothetical protein